MENDYDDKFIKKILIAISDEKYNEEKLEVKISCDRDNLSTYVLKKIVNLYQNNVYGLECSRPVNGNRIYFSVEINSNSYIHKTIYAYDDKNYNHVNDICKTNFLIPKEKEASYGIYFGGEIDKNGKFKESAISLFITN